MRVSSDLLLLLPSATPRSRTKRAFTLFELLLVVAILALVAGAVLASAGDPRTPVQRDLALHEMAQLRDALLRFRADTGWLPGQGPFDLVRTPPDPASRAAVPAGVISARFGIPAAEVPKWFDAAANLWELVENPLAETDHALRRWDPDRRRGWRGPYLSMDSEGLLRAGFVNRRFDPYGSPPPGEPPNEGLQATVGLPASHVFPAVADPFVRSSETWVWSSYTAPGQVLDSQGSPYLLFLPPEREEARLICLGPDRVLDPQQGSRDDLVLYLFR